MPQYQYRCKGCARLFACGERSDVTRCPSCLEPANRVFAFYTATSMREHWNTAVGQYVSNSQEMSDALKRQSEAASVRTGIDHQYELVTPAEMKDAGAHGASEDGLDETRRRQFNDLTP